MQIFIGFVFIIVITSFEVNARETEGWGHRAPSPAIVNPVVRSSYQQFISLSGDWEFTVQSPYEASRRLDHYLMIPDAKWPNSRTIKVPSCWEAQGIGEPGMSKPWDITYDNCQKPLKHIYMGYGWYRKTFSIPEKWKEQKIWLKVGGVRSQGWFWVNGKRVACVDNYCATVKYDITDLIKFGQDNVITVQVRNDSPSRKGLFSATHRFGGLYRDIEIEATPDGWIDYTWARGMFDNKSVIINTTVCRNIHETDNKQKELTIKYTINTTDGIVAGEGVQKITFDKDKNSKEISLEIPLKEFRPWSPDTPNLYIVNIELIDGSAVIHGWMERFGVRKFEVRGKQFYFNNNPFFLRGFGDDFIYPLTLVSPPDREYHKTNLAVARRSGFNYVRTHTHCEIPEYYEAADEAGILIQTELPYYEDYSTEAFPFDPKRDLEEVITHYRRYVSLATYSMGNEGYLGSPLDEELYKLVKTLDPDKLVLHQDGVEVTYGPYNTVLNSDFQGGPIRPWIPGTVKKDLPFKAHEYLNLTIKLDPRLEPKFTGIMEAPRSFKKYESELTNAGLNRKWGDACLNAAGALQKYYQKNGIEAARFDSACGGYDFWTIVDVMVKQGDTWSAQGLYNAFWETKPGGFTPEEFCKFNGPTVILSKYLSENQIVVSEEELSIDFWISNFGNTPIKQGQLTWTITAEGKTLKSGKLSDCNVNLGNVVKIGTSKMMAPKVQEPIRASFSIKIDNTNISNSWDIWIFPKYKRDSGNDIAVSKDLYDVLSKRYSKTVKLDKSYATKTGLIVSSSQDSSEVFKAVAAGKNAIILGGAEGSPNVKLGWWSIGSQVGTAFANHAAFGKFPQSGVLDPLWFRILKNGAKPLPIKNGTDVELLAVGEGIDKYYLYICERKIGKGRILMTYGLDLISDTPEGVFLLNEFVNYMRNK